MSEITKHMDKTIDALKHNFSKVRTGRANSSVLADILVDYYGVPTPITQLAAVKVPEAHMLVVEPWDKSSLKAVEKAIESSDLGITPSNDGSCIRLPFPAPTEERRRELVKDCNKLAEEARISIRNIRREANNHYEKMEDVSEDEIRRALDGIQKDTDNYISKIDTLLKEKEAEVMEI